MKTGSLQDILSEFLGEIQDLRANQKVLSGALGKAGAKISLADAADFKGLFLQEAKKDTEFIQKRIDSLGD
jgi:hypothetical protein